MKNQYGVIVHFTRWHRLVGIYEEKVVHPISENNKNKMRYVCKMLNYILLEHYEIYGCEVGHSWEATINSRVRNIVACPICNGRKLQSGDNDIATTHPEVLQLWDYEKNTGVNPTSSISNTDATVDDLDGDCIREYISRTSNRSINETMNKTQLAQMLEIIDKNDPSNRRMRRSQEDSCRMQRRKALPSEMEKSRRPEQEIICMW